MLPRRNFHSTVALLGVLLLAAPAAAQQPAPGLDTWIGQLSAFDYATRMNAARQIRRVPREQAFPALTTAVLEHQDQFVRARALVLLTGFGPAGVADVMQRVMADRNDRLREVAYRWFELNPDPRLTQTLLTALNTEQAEFVRPALVRALAAVGDDQRVQRALVSEVGRGLDFFRSAVIDALGAHKATYAVDAIASVARLEGPLQDDAVLALGRIGGLPARATLATFTEPPPDLVAGLQAALCLVGDACAARLDVLKNTARGSALRPQVARAAVRALGDVASSENPAAVAILVELGTVSDPTIVNDVATALAIAGVRRPVFVIDWLASAPDTTRASAVTLLREGFETLEEDFAEEQFYVAARSAYWNAPENSAARSLAASLIDTLEF